MYWLTHLNVDNNIVSLVPLFGTCLLIDKIYSFFFLISLGLALTWTSKLPIYFNKVDSYLIFCNINVKVGIEW